MQSFRLGKTKVVEHATTALKPASRVSSRFNRLKLYGPLGLLLHHDGAIPDSATGDDVTDPFVWLRL
jgi:hypothetical protein